MNRPKRTNDIIWRLDGEEGQIIVLSKEDLPLPLILNPTATKIFLLCNGKNSIEEIAISLCEEFGLNDFASVLGDVQEQINNFIKKGIVQI